MQPESGAKKLLRLPEYTSTLYDQPAQHGKTLPSLPHNNCAQDISVSCILATRDFQNLTPRCTHTENYQQNRLNSIGLQLSMYTVLFHKMLFGKAVPLGASKLLSTHLASIQVCPWMCLQQVKRQPTIVCSNPANLADLRLVPSLVSAAESGSRYKPCCQAGYRRLNDIVSLDWHHLGA